MMDFKFVIITSFVNLYYKYRKYNNSFLIFINIPTKLTVFMNFWLYIKKRVLIDFENKHSNIFYFLCIEN